MWVHETGMKLWEKVIASLHMDGECYMNVGTLDILDILFPNAKFW